MTAGLLTDRTKKNRLADKTKKNRRNTFFTSLNIPFESDRINNDLAINREVKTSHIISRSFGNFMMPLSRVQIRIKLTMRIQQLQLISIPEEPNTHELY